MARVTSALAAATLFALVSYPQAQSLPAEGELHVMFTATQVLPVNPMPGRRKAVRGAKLDNVSLE
jgi:hypothetical protein